MLKIKIIIAIIVFSFLVISSQQVSSENVSKFEQALGNEVVKILNNPDVVTVFRVKPTLQIKKGQQPETIGLPIILSNQQKENLLVLILNDKSYLFGVAKTNIFITQMIIKFESDLGEILLLVNLSDSQFKFMSANSTLLTDYTPVKEELNSFLNALYIEDHN